ncbi:MAG: efflux RND transporter periplasmic adaptor subunit [Marinobacterium sp.]|nr:efflux RND transporter periplasmic adaptor subunit [Marinobacterium sp.]
MKQKIWNVTPPWCVFAATVRQQLKTCSLITWLPLVMLAALTLQTSMALAADGEQQKKAPPRGLPAEVITVKARNLNTEVQAIGSLRANERIQLRPEQSGRINAILFEEGQLVRKGTPLFRLDGAIYQAELKEAQARVHLSEIAYRRADSLLKKRVGSEQERDSTLAQLQVDQARQALAQTRLDKMQVVAPFSGRTGLRLVSPGDYVTAGQDMVELTDLSSLKVDFRVPEIYLPAIRTGQTLKIELDTFPGQVFEGSVYAIAPGADSRAHNIELRARIANPDGKLRPGLFARIQLILASNANSILIPEQAIIPDNGAFFVQRVKEGNVIEKVQVQLGQRRPGEVEVRSGLNTGDVLVIAGQLKLRPGMPVTPIFVDGSAPTVAKGE